jgi:hypothetical protein
MPRKRGTSGDCTSSLPCPACAPSLSPDYLPAVTSLPHEPAILYVVHLRIGYQHTVHRRRRIYEKATVYHSTRPRTSPEWLRQY